MSIMQRKDGAPVPPFPRTAFWNINHLGLSRPERRNSKITNLKFIARQSEIVGIQEVWNSPAVAEDIFFSNLPDRMQLYNVPESRGGVAMSISRAFAEANSIAYDPQTWQSPNHSCVNEDGSCQALHWQAFGRVKVILNFYLNPRCDKTRANQMSCITQWLASFREQYRDYEVDVLAGGDRNFVLSEAERESSAGTALQLAHESVKSWDRLLTDMKGYAVEQPEFTFRRQGRRRDGQAYFVREILDVTITNTDPLDWHDWSIATVARDDVPHPFASDHLPVECRCAYRSSRNKQTSSTDQTPRTPEWIFENDCFREALQRKVKEWKSDSERWTGLEGLLQISDIIRVEAKHWLETTRFEAVSNDHRFEISLSLLRKTCREGFVDWKSVTSATQRYPGLKAVVKCAITNEDSGRRIRIDRARLKQHVSDLADKMVRDKEEHDGQQNEHDESADIAFSETLQQHSAGVGALRALKALIPKHKHSITILWDPAAADYTDDADRISELLLEEGHRRQGRSRGDASCADEVLRHSKLDLRGCQPELSKAEMLEVMLSIQKGKAPGPNGIPGIAYKLLASELVDVFGEALSQLTRDGVQVHESFLDALWVPIGKVPNPTTMKHLRDLELPNEDRKVLSRMVSKILDKGMADSLHPAQQAFCSGRNIMRNVVGLNEAYYEASERRRLKFVLCLDCSKGYNFMGWDFVMEVLRRAGLNNGVLTAIRNLTFGMRTTLVFGGQLRGFVRFACGLRQGDPLACFLYILAVDPLFWFVESGGAVDVMFGFCDDWEFGLADGADINLLQTQIELFEKASGQCVNKDKSLLLTTMEIDDVDLEAARGRWQDMRVVTRCKILGLLVGASVEVSEVFKPIVDAIRERLRAFAGTSMSIGMRVLACNVFGLTKLSYVHRVLTIPDSTKAELDAICRQFVLPVPLLKMPFLAHLQNVFGINLALRDARLANTAALVTNMRTLERTGFEWGSAGRHQSEHPMRFRHHFRKACSAVLRTTGATARALLPVGAVRHEQRRLYHHLLRGELSIHETYFSDRMRSRGLDGEAARGNLSRLPRSTPQGHRWALFQWLLNMVPTKRRYRFMNREVVTDIEACLFCRCDEDSIEHYCACGVLRGVFDVVMSAVPAGLAWDWQHVMLQCHMDGEQIRSMLSFMHALLRVRRQLATGRNHHNMQDMIAHFRRLIENPWLAWSGAISTRKERRQRRARNSVPPTVLQGEILYQSDGAARGQGRTGSGVGQASYGAVCLVSGEVVGRCARCVGEASNNYAEWLGLLACLRHAGSLPNRRLMFQLDSALVTNQINGAWACRHPDLRQLFEEAWRLKCKLEGEHRECRFIHIFREFNARADSLANEALDTHREIRERWPSSLP